MHGRPQQGLRRECIDQHRDRALHGGYGSGAARVLRLEVLDQVRGVLDDRAIGASSTGITKNPICGRIRVWKNGSVGKHSRYGTPFLMRYERALPV